jgi:hypothetical protein
VCLPSCPNLFVSFAAPRVFHLAHARDFRFGAGDFVVGNLTTLFFVSAFAGFSVDTLPFLFSAVARKFLFDFTPALLLDAESVLCRKSFGFYL